MDLMSDDGKVEFSTGEEVRDKILSKGSRSSSQCLAPKKYRVRKQETMCSGPCPRPSSWEHAIPHRPVTLSLDRKTVFSWQVGRALVTQPQHNHRAFKF